MQWKLSTAKGGRRKKQNNTMFFFFFAIFSVTFGDAQGGGILLPRSNIEQAPVEMVRFTFQSTQRP